MVSSQVFQALWFAALILQPAATKTRERKQPQRRFRGAQNAGGALLGQFDELEKRLEVTGVESANRVDADPRRGQ
jgi:hypothetical protein